MKTLTFLLLLVPSLAQAATGTARVVHADMKSGHAQFTVYVEPDTGGRFLVSSGSKPDTRFHDGDRVLAKRVSGVKVKASPTWLLEPLVDRSRVRVAASVSGVHPTAFIIVNYANVQNTATQANSVTGAQRVSDYYTQTSRGKVTMPITVLGPVTVATSYSGGCPSWNIAARQADALVSTGAYVHKVYLLPPAPGCYIAGLGTIGGNPSSAWIFGDGADSTSTIVHELGHNLGLWHSHSRVCVGADLGAGCSNSEYGDLYDVMGSGGSSGSSGGFNASQQRILGWAEPRAVGAGRYTLTPFETTRDSLRLVRGNDALGVTYYASRGGVAQHLQSTASSGAGIYLLMPSGKVFVAAGTSWNDAASGWTITTESITSTSAVVLVSTGTAEPPPPPPAGSDVTMTFTRSTSAGATFAVVAGSYQCVRQVGGTSQLRIVSGGTVLAKGPIVNPAVGKTFTLRCAVLPASVMLFVNGTVKLIAAVAP